MNEDPEDLTEQLLSKIHELRTELSYRALEKERLIWQLNKAMSIATILAKADELFDDGELRLLEQQVRKW